jgi:GDP-4-dehydro-6-deoxy-D-mannose reductase
MKILITGIGGTGGSFLANFLLNKKKISEIHGTIRNIKKLDNIKFLQKNKKIKIIKCDLNNYIKIIRCLKKNSYKYIFHLASDADVLKSFLKPRGVLINNTMSTINFLEACREIKTKSKIIICSTSEVYGKVNEKEQPITEKTQIAPVNPYAVSKTLQDLLSQIYCKIYKLNIVITRMFTYTNPKRNNLFATAFAKQVVQIEKGERKFLVHGNLKTKRTFIDIRDAMNAYWLAAKYGKNSEIYNIGGRYSIWLYDYIKLLQKKSKVKFITKLDKKLLRPIDLIKQIPSSKKFAKHTGWKQKFNINKATDYLLDYLRNNEKYL